MDVVQEANCGLLGMLDAYEGTEGYPFKALVIVAVKEWLIETRTRDRGVCLPRKKLKVLAQLHQVRDRLVAQLGRFPSVREVATAVALLYEQVEHLLLVERLRFATSLEALQETDERQEDEYSFAPLFASEQKARPTWKSERVRQAMQVALTDHQREVLSLRYGLSDLYADSGLSQGEVATLLGVRHGAVEATELAATNRLRAVLASALTEQGALQVTSTRPCEVCEQPVVQTYGRVRRYCSRTCERRAVQERRQRLVTEGPRVMYCVQCGTQMLYTGGRVRRYCTMGCERKARRARARLLAKMGRSA
jgi:RNA polymerase sigma factor (sigma-70 family)